MEVGQGFPVIEKGHEKLSSNEKAHQKSKRLHTAQLATFKKGVFTAYKPSVIEEKQNQAHNEVAATVS